MFASNVVETVLGFGSTVLALALGAAWYPIDFLLPVLVPVNLLLSLYIVTRHRREVRWEALGRKVLPLTGLGLIVGLAVFTLTAAKALKVGYGLFVTGYAAFGLVGWWTDTARTSAARIPEAAAPVPGTPAPVPGAPAIVPGAPAACTAPGASSPAVSRPLPPLAGALWLLGAGFFQGLYGSGGPMLVYYAGREFPAKGSFRSTLSGVWVLLQAAMVAVYGLTGKLNAGTLQAGARLVPVLAAAILAGEWLHARVSQKAFRLAVLAVLLVAGVSLVVW